MGKKQAEPLLASDHTLDEKMQALMEEWTLAEDAFEKAAASSNKGHAVGDDALSDALTLAQARLEEDRAAKAMQDAAVRISELEVADISGVLKKFDIWASVTAPEGETEWLSPIDALAMSAIRDLRRLSQSLN